MEVCLPGPYLGLVSGPHLSGDLGGTVVCVQKALQVNLLCGWADNLGLHLSVSRPWADLISKTEVPTFLREGGAQDLVWGDSKGAGPGWPAPHLLPRGTDTPLSSALWASVSSWSAASSWLVRRDRWLPHTQGAVSSFFIQVVNTRWLPSCAQHCDVGPGGLAVGRTLTVT